MVGTLYLVPTPLGDLDPVRWLPPATVEVARRLRHWIVETPKDARRVLGRVGIEVPIRDLTIEVLDEHTTDARIADLTAPMLNGLDVGLMSDAGCPVVADPGARLVRAAHAAAVPVVPLVGPSAVLLALMASGLGGQAFTFHGYLPVETRQRADALRAIELASRRERRTQVMIETPYRNVRLFDAIVEHCRPETLVCVAAELTLASQFVATRTVRDWRERRPALDKRPAVFVLAAE